jgi:membrane dipeptidase
MFLTRELTREEEQRALELHQRAIVADPLGALRPTEDYIADMEAGGLTAVGLTLVADTHNFRETMNWIAWWNKQLTKWSDRLVLATSADDIRQAKEDGRIAVIYLFQNGKPFEDEIGYVEIFRRLGVTSSQLTYQIRTFLGDGCGEPGNAGLSLYGREVVHEMNRVGMLVDLSHAGENTAKDTLAVSKDPVYYSHACLQGVHGSIRNVSDEMLELLALNGGMICPTGLHIGPEPQPPVSSMMDHVAYAVQKLGIDHVGFSTDYLKSDPSVYKAAYLDEEGYLTLQYPGSLKLTRYKWDKLGRAQQYPWFLYPKGLETYRGLPNVTRELVVRGFSDDEILKILGENYLVLFKEVVG